VPGKLSDKLAHPESSRRTPRAVTISPMSRLFESFEFLDRGWDIRTLENLSLRSVFLWLLPLLFLLGADTAIMAYLIFHLHRFNWSVVFNLAVIGLLCFRCARLIYRRLPH
jgi:hypothetical protein